MRYKIKLETFEGPLDLLLHLIEKQELDINNIPIAEITEQYLDYLKAMEELDLGIASEFLVMGATLLAIKAKMLLPRPAVQEEKTADEEDPRSELVLKLLEYQKYKAIIKELKEKETSQQKIYGHPFDYYGYMAGLPLPNPLSNVSPWDLLAVYQEALASCAEPEPVHQVQQETVTVETQIEMISDLLCRNPSGLEFHDLLPEKPSPSRIVVTFLALLELLRLRQVKVYQPTSFGRIHIFLDNVTGGQEDAVC